MILQAKNLMPGLCVAHELGLCPRRFRFVFLRVERRIAGLRSGDVPPRTRLLYTAVICGIVLSDPARTQGAAAQRPASEVPPTISEVPVPGGLRAALAAIGDPMPPDRAQFLTEIIRRTYGARFDSNTDRRAVALRSLVAVLDTAETSHSTSSDTVPLPLSDRIWIDVVFRGQATPQTLVSSILQSRTAALFYCGLLSLDDETRAWLAGQQNLIAELASSRAGAFVAAAPGLRIVSGAVRPIGGELAAPVWEALVGEPLDRPVDFVRALVSRNHGYLAHFFGTIGQLTPSQIRVALNLEAATEPARIDSAQRLYRVFHAQWGGGTIEQGAFTRPTLDPALLVADLTSDGSGRPQVPGTRGLWRAVFSSADASRGPVTLDDPRARSAWEAPADFPWLCEQVFAVDTRDQYRRYTMVLFASRYLEHVAPGLALDVIEAIRAAANYPALTGALERVGVTDVSTFAAAARRAATLSAIGDERRAVTALAQFQGALALITRAAVRGSLDARSASALVSSVSAVPLSDRGEYEGRLASWFNGWIETEPAAQARGVEGSAPAAAEEVLNRVAGETEQQALRLLAGPIVAKPQIIEWEGTRYRVDLRRAEAFRLVTALGEPAGSYLSEAVAVANTANAFPTQPPREVLVGYARALVAFDQALAAGGGGEGSRGALQGRYSDAAAALRRAVEAGDVSTATRRLRGMADDLLARGLMDMAYAAALGPRDGLTLPAAVAARRHDFGLRDFLDRRTAWRLPAAGVPAEGQWRVIGSVLGLDVALADFSLVRVSSRPLARRPTLNELDRRAFIDAVALVAPASLTDADRELIVAAIRRGRARLEAARTPTEALAIADDTRLSPLRRTLLSWVVTHDPERVAAFLSPSELLWLGLGSVPMEALRPWGAPAGWRLGCLCLQLVDRRPWEGFAGRWQAPMMASAFPDLNLRLAELLSDLRMPAALLPSVLPAATRDFIDGATSRDLDDRRALVEYVQALGADRLEQYLALLTTDGPLVPVGTAASDREDRRPLSGAVHQVQPR